MATPRRRKPVMMQLYGNAPVDEEIVSQYGRIPYLRWLELERQRIEGGEGRVAEVVKSKDGKVAGLRVNKVADSYTTKGEQHKRPPNFRGATARIRLRAMEIDGVTV